MGKIGLYTGRFQPLHNGHKKVIDLLVETFDEVKIALGQKRNGDILDYSEREEIIQKTFPTSNVKLFRIIDLPQNHPDYNQWGSYVIDKVGSVDYIVTGRDDDNLIEDDFYELGYPIILIPRYQGISGTEIRRSIRNGNSHWEEYVPIKTKELIWKKFKDGKK